MNSIILFSALFVLVSCSSKNSRDGVESCADDVQAIMDDWIHEFHDVDPANPIDFKLGNHNLIMVREDNGDGELLTYTQTIPVARDASKLVAQSSKIQKIEAMFISDGFEIFNKTTGLNDFPQPQIVKFTYSKGNARGTLVMCASPVIDGYVNITALIQINPKK